MGAYYRNFPSVNFHLCEGGNDETSLESLWIDKQFKEKETLGIER